MNAGGATSRGAVRVGLLRTNRIAISANDVNDERGSSVTLDDSRACAAAKEGGGRKQAERRTVGPIVRTLANTGAVPIILRYTVTAARSRRKRRYGSAHLADDETQLWMDFFFDCEGGTIHFCPVARSDYPRTRNWLRGTFGYMVGPHHRRARLWFLADATVRAWRMSANRHEAPDQSRTRIEVRTP